MAGIIVLVTVTIVLATSGVPTRRSEWLSLGGQIAVAFVTIAVVVWLAARRGGAQEWRARLPEGSLLVADTGINWIGVGYRGFYRGVTTDRIRSRHIASVRMIFADGGQILVPDELTNDATHPGHAPAAQHDAVRTFRRADDHLAARLTSASRHHPGVAVATAALIGYIPITLCALYTKFGSLQIVDVASVSVIAAVGLWLIAYQMLIGIPRRNRRLVPPGTALAAEFGPAQIGVRLGGRTELMSVASIRRVRSRGATLEISSSLQRVTMVIPAELVPPQVAEQLLRRFGSRG